MDISDKPSDFGGVDGRLFDITSEIYMLRADEVGPLDATHQVVTTMLGGLFPAGSGVDRILSRSSEGHGPSVLDIGTGSGAWAIDVALKYPNAEVVGLDLAPVNTLSTLPSNCRFEADDASLGLKEYGRLDVIHARSVLQGINDHASLCADIAKVLNPQGIFISVEEEIGLYDKDKVKYGPQKEGDPDFCWAQEVTMAYREVLRKRTPGFSDRQRVEEILNTIPGDPWQTIGEATFFVPCGPYANGNETERNAGRLMQQLAFRATEGLRAPLLASEYDAGYVNRLIGMALDEIESCRVVNFLKWNVVWAVKGN